LFQRSVLRLIARDESYTVVVEPWAEEFVVQIGEDCQVVALHPEIQPTLGAELAGARLIVWVYESGSTCEFWRGRIRERVMSVPIPF
jgi:hypothetical protein